MLRCHIDKWHILAYLILALQQGREWPIQVPTVKNVTNLRYMLNELKSFVEKGISLQKIPPRPTNGSLPGHATNIGPRDGVPPFSLPIFRKYLAHFIVADDQALSVVEGKEFRQLLLLLRDDLNDKDIPHRSKMKTEVVQAWQDHFVVLKQDLAICVLTFVGSHC